MAGFIDGYGVAEARRERIRNRIIAIAALVAVAGGVLYFLFRDYREESRVKQFLQLLRDGQYESAYQAWGCSSESPCRDYSFAKFMEDWGPDSSHANIAEAVLGRTRSCSAGIIQTLQFPGDEVLLWVNRGDLVIGFAPWPVCDPRWRPGTQLP